MDADEIEYVISYFGHLMTEQEALALKHWSYNFGIENSEWENDDQRIRRRNMLLRSGWITEDEEILSLLDEGIEEFKLKSAKRIVAEEDVFFNICEKCKMLARTPKAKQCRYCNHDWH